jgi:hypothetical protein
MTDAKELLFRVLVGAFVLGIFIGFFVGIIVFVLAS